MVFIPDVSPDHHMFQELADHTFHLAAMIPELDPICLVGSPERAAVKGKAEKRVLLDNIADLAFTQIPF
jgi:hypothetical protein